MIYPSNLNELCRDIMCGKITYIRPVDTLRIIILAIGINALKLNHSVVVEPPLLCSLYVSMGLTSSSAATEDVSQTLRPVPHRKHLQLLFYDSIKCLVVSYFFNLSPEQPMSLSLLTQAIQLDSRLRQTRKHLDFWNIIRTDVAVDADAKARLGSQMTSLETAITHRVIERYVTSLNIIRPVFDLQGQIKGSALLEAMSLAFRSWFREPFDDALNLSCIKVLVTCFDVYNIGIYSVGQLNAVFRLLNFSYPLFSTVHCSGTPLSNDDVIKILVDARYSSNDIATSIIESRPFKNVKSYKFRRDFIRCYRDAALCAYVFCPPLGSCPLPRDESFLQKKQLLALTQELIFSQSTLGRHRSASIERELKGKWDMIHRDSPAEAILEYVFAIFQLDCRGFLSSELRFVQNYLISNQFYRKSNNSIAHSASVVSIAWIDRESFFELFDNISISSAAGRITLPLSPRDARLRLQALVRQEALLAASLEDMGQLQYMLRVNALYAVANRFHVASVIKYWRSILNLSSELVPLWIECQGFSFQKISEIFVEYAGYLGTSLRHEKVDLKPYLTSIRSRSCISAFESKIRTILCSNRRAELLRLDQAMSHRRDEVERLSLLFAEEIFTGSIKYISSRSI